MHYTRRRLLKTGAAMSAFLPFFSACSGSEVKSASLSKGFMDGVRTAQLIAQGEITALEATEAAISRAEAHNPAINAIASTDYEAARERAASDLTGAMAGVPTFIKDLANWQGLQTLYGSRAFKGNMATEDGPLSKVWRAELGPVILGKSTSPEMGLISSTEPLVTGPTRNPWNTDHIPGGSSGGAAALTAARIVPFAHASDGGGSIRIPAACCGLVGLKPSHKAVPIGRSSQEGNQLDISVDLAVTLTVRDTAAIFASTARQPDLQTPVTGPARKRLKIAFAPDPVTPTYLNSEVRRAVEETAALCSDLGHEVKAYQMPLNGEEFSDKFLLYWSAGAARFARQAAQFSGKPPSPEILEPWTLSLAQNFLSRQKEFPAAMAYLQNFASVYDQYFIEGDFDLLLTPTIAAPAPQIGVQSPTRDFEGLQQAVSEFAAFTAPMNVSGAASISLPLGQSQGGLPLASMFSGRKGDDLKLLALAYELEEARPWIGRIPPLLTV